MAFLKEVTFFSNGCELVGDLYYPTKENKSNEEQDVIIVITPWGGVKEQTAGIYARKLTEKGFITMAFDHTSYGKSEGVPRCNEDPFLKIEDIKKAVKFIKDDVAPKRIFLLGICSGAAYVAYAAAAIQNDIVAIASVSGYYHDLYHRKYLVDEIGKKATIDLIAKARQAGLDYMVTGEPTYIPHVAANEKSLEINKDFFSYYGTNRGKTDSYVCKTLFSSLEKLACFSAIPAVRALSLKPYLFIVGSNAKSAYESEDAHSSMVDNNAKELFIINDANHTDLYDVEKYVNQVISKISTFFTSAL